MCFEISVEPAHWRALGTQSLKATALEVTELMYYCFNPKFQRHRGTVSARDKMTRRRQEGTEDEDEFTGGEEEEFTGGVERRDEGDCRGRGGGEGYGIPHMNCSPLTLLKRESCHTFMHAYAHVHTRPQNVR